MKNLYKEITLEVLTEKYIDTFDSGHKVAKDLGVSYSTFNRALRLHGLKARGRVSQNEKLRDKKWITEQYYTEGKSTREIAREIGSTAGAVHSALKWLGIKMRSSNEGLKLRYPKGRWGKDASNWKGGRRRASTNGSYISIYSPEHPNCDKSGYVMEHRLVMEKELGRYLKKTEFVHHINGDKKDNNIVNLQLMSSHSEHTQFHMNATKEVARLRQLLESNGIAY